MAIISRRAARWIVVGTATVLLGPATPAAFAATSTTTSGTLALKSMEFSPDHVDARTGQAVTTLRWTITESNPTALGLSGHVSVRQELSPGVFTAWAFESDFSYQSTCCGAVWVSGTPQESTYEYTIGVPQYAASASATWEVTSLTAGNDLGHQLSLQGADLNPYGHVLHANTSIDSTAPSYDRLDLRSQITSPARPYAYVKDRSASVEYDLTVQDWQSGFWKGRLEMTGPGGERIHADFSADGGRCGVYYWSQIQDVTCGVMVTFPAGSASGVWRVSHLWLTNNADVTLSVKDPPAQSITVTSDTGLTASGFSANPNPVDNWTSDVLVALTMAVTGAEQGITAVYVDVEAGTSGCMAWGSTPTANADGTVSIPVRMFTAAERCKITGIAVVDGAGQVAVYGGVYGAPDPGVTITRIPDTTPPIITSVTATYTIYADQNLSVVKVTVQQAPSLAPVESYSLKISGPDGSLLTSQVGGTSQFPDGHIELYAYIYEILGAGDYTVTVSLTDAARLTSAPATATFTVPAS